MTLRALFKALLFFAGTFLHELSHLILSLLLGKPERFSIFPRVEGDALVLGRVESRVRFKVLGAFIAVAPVLWWVALCFLLYKLNIFTIDSGTGRIRVLPFFRKIVLFPLQSIFILWLSLQLFWAGKLSRQDLKAFLQSIFSISGAILIIITILLYLIMA